MKRLISPNILTKFENTITEQEYKEGWKKLKEYQEAKDLIKTYSEISFQSEFLDKIFGNIFGYIPRTKSLRKANLVVEYKSPNSSEKVDGVILDKVGNVKIVIELKSVKDTSAKDLLKKKRGGSDSSTPIQQGNKYLFQFKDAELAIVSNFDTIIIFNKKEYFRQEYSLFNLSYSEFKELYLILSANSFWSGLTKLMITQTNSEEKKIDDEFYVKCSALYRMLANQIDDKKYIDDLFNKFLAITILEDNAKLPSNIIRELYYKKNDFLNSSNSYWDIWVKFFKTIKSKSKKREHLNISDQISSMNVWKKVSYLDNIKINKATIELVYEISKYDLWSISPDKLFFEISKQINNCYNLIDNDNAFDFYKLIFKNHNPKFKSVISGFQTLAFITKKSISTDFPLIKLYNEIIKNEIVASNNGEIIMTQKTNSFDEYYIIQDFFSIEDEYFINEFKDNIDSIIVNEIFEPIVLTYKIKKMVTDKIFVKRISKDNKIKEFEIDRKEIKDKIIILSSEDEKWLENYKRVEENEQLLTLADVIEIVDKENAKIKFNINTHSIIFYNEKLEIWDNSIDDYFEINEDDYLYLRPKKDYVKLILESDDFQKLLTYLNITKDNFLSIPISKYLMSETYLNLARKKADLNKKIELFKFELRKAKKEGRKLKIIEYEKDLEYLYEEEENINKKIREQE